MNKQVNYGELFSTVVAFRKAFLEEIDGERVSFFWVLSLGPPSFLDPSSIPVFIVLLFVRPLLSLTTGEPSDTILQHLQSSFAANDFPSGIVLVAGEVVPLRVVIVLLHAYKQQSI